MVYGETGTLPIKKHIISRMITYYMRIVNGKQTKLSYVMYKLMRCKYRQLPNEKFQWMMMIEDSLAKLGMKDIWDYQDYGFSTDYINQAVKLRIKDTFLQEWSEDLNQHVHCDNYRMMKHAVLLLGASPESFSQ